MGREKGTMKKLDWKGVGQFVSVCVKLSTIIIAVFKKMKVGIEIMGWLAEDGKKYLEEACHMLATRFHLRSREIDLNVLPRIPSTHAFNPQIEQHKPCGRVMVEKRDDGLYLDGIKVVLYRAERQLGQREDFLFGHQLRIELEGKPVLNACLLDFLLDNQEFIPDDWKSNAVGDTWDEHIIYVNFWGTVYKRADLGEPVATFVRSLCWHRGAWCERFRWSGDGFNHSWPAAVMQQ
jgi:hypothetical protein